MTLTKNERYELIRDIAQAVVIAMNHHPDFHPIENPIPDSPMVTLHEAARILGYSDSHMRRIKDQYPHIKHGNKPQGKLLFYRDKLIKNFVENNLIETYVVKKINKQTNR